MGCCTSLDTQVGKGGATSQTMGEVANWTGAERTRRHIASVPGCPSTCAWVVVMSGESPPSSHARIDAGVVNRSVEYVGTHNSWSEATLERRARRRQRRRSQARSKRGQTTLQPTTGDRRRRDRHQWAHVPGVCSERVKTVAGSDT